MSAVDPGALGVGRRPSAHVPRPTPHAARAGALVRPAVLADVPALERLMAPYVATGDLLPRSNYDLCRHIKEYVVAEAPDAGVVGCGSLKIYSSDLAELAECQRREHEVERRGARPRSERGPRAHAQARVLPQARLRPGGEGALPPQGVGGLREVPPAELL